jgi:hypothetical protein
VSFLALDFIRIIALSLCLPVSIWRDKILLIPLIPYGHVIFYLSAIFYDQVFCYCFKLIGELKIRVASLLPPGRGRLKYKLLDDVTDDYIM